MESVTAFAPASIGNVSCGFDIFGLSLESLGDTVTVKKNDSGDVSITEISGVFTQLPRDAKKNCATAGIIKLLSDIGVTGQGIDVTINKGIPPGSGLGSSSASAVAGVVAANALLGSPKTAEELCEYAAYAERHAAGSQHADNIAPSLLGGMVLIRSYEPLKIVRLPVPHGLDVVIALPELTISTAEARALIPPTLPMDVITSQLRDVATFVSGLYSGNQELFLSSLTERIAEPVRKNLIPHYDDVKEAALSAGAGSFAISGAGPAVFCFTAREASQEVAQVLSRSFDSFEISVQIFISRISKKGAKVL